jgi:hypothetical protein
MMALAYAHAFMLEGMADDLQVLIPFSFVSLGMLIKYGDQAFDEDCFSKRSAFMLAAPSGIWMGSMIALDYDSATIFIGLLLALLLAAKYDNVAFKVGFAAALMITTISIVFEVGGFDPLGVLLVGAAAYVDERTNDLEASGRIGSLLQQRPFLKVAVLIMCLFGIFSSFMYFFAFMGFDFGYSLVESICMERKEGLPEAV